MCYYKKVRFGHGRRSTKRKENVKTQTKWHLPAKECQKLKETNGTDFPAQPSEATTMPLPSF